METGKTVLVTGSRRYDDELQMRTVLESLRARGYTRLVHGDCRGADRLAGQVGQKLGFQVHSHPAEWKKYGRAAGPIRNRRMLEDHPEIDLVVWFHERLTDTSGTTDMISAAIDRELPIERGSV